MRAKLRAARFTFPAVHTGASELRWRPSGFGIGLLAHGVLLALLLLAFRHMGESGHDSLGYARGLLIMLGLPALAFGFTVTVAMALISGLVKRIRARSRREPEYHLAISDEGFRFWREAVRAEPVPRVHKGFFQLPIGALHHIRMSRPEGLQTRRRFEFDFDRMHVTCEIGDPTASRLARYLADSFSDRIQDDAATEGPV
ncbi:MAG TPA: hypothetical protein ENI85_07885 [Deltaproteobacteria bacterium]|nr:hypothetical protein [Deltaproteobacteria bacterium]